MADCRVIFRSASKISNMFRVKESPGVSANYAGLWISSALAVMLDTWVRPRDTSPAGLQNIVDYLSARVMFWEAPLLPPGVP